jgi:hypothetical protein
MPTYVYETIPRLPEEPVKRFEVVQSMRDASLETHPETGEPVRRIVSGGYGMISSRRQPAASIASAASCRPGCACHAGPRIPSF